MARHLRHVIARVKAQVSRQLAVDVDVDQLAREVGHDWRQRLLTPAMTVRLFLLQILHGNVAITALRHIGQVTVQASSYCAARARLPLELFTRLFDAVARQAASVARVNPDADASTLLDGRRVLLADATTFSTPDTPELRDHFGYPPGQREGLGLRSPRR